MRGLLHQTDEQGVKVQRVVGSVQLEEGERAKLGEDLSQVRTPLTAGEGQGEGVRGREGGRVCAGEERGRKV